MGFGTRSNRRSPCSDAKVIVIAVSRKMITLAVVSAERGGSGASTLPRGSSRLHYKVTAGSGCVHRPEKCPIALSAQIAVESSRSRFTLLHEEDYGADVRYRHGLLPAVGVALQN